MNFDQNLGSKPLKMAVFEILKSQSLISRKIFHFSELEAYSSMVSALRAQGELTKERRKVMSDLSNVLNISIERHKAEIRRAVNDELLNTVAAR